MKSMKLFKLFIPIFLIGFVSSCIKEVKLLPKNSSTLSDSIYFNPDFPFEWQLSKTVKINIGVESKSPNDEKHFFIIYNKNPELGGKVISSGSTYKNKNFETLISIPTIYSSIYIQEIIPGFSTIGKETIVNNGTVNVVFNTIKKNLGKTDNNINPPQLDSDFDSVPDSIDCYPQDSTKAFNNYYPSEKEMATLAFEDLWPWLGDYDLNDVVIKYNYNVITNATNKVTQIKASYTLMATGGSNKNGFGVEFPLNSLQVANLSGATLENGQAKAVILIFNNMKNEMQNYNTIVSQQYSDTVNYNIAFNVKDGPSLIQFGLNEFNPFIWNSSLGRGYEIHLPNKSPTSLADFNLFGTNADNSNLACSQSYISKTNEMPWALNIPISFDYPTEKSKINTAYLKFNEWVNSKGETYKDWYLDKMDYRNPKYIYKRP